MEVGGPIHGARELLEVRKISVMVEKQRETEIKRKEIRKEKEREIKTVYVERMQTGSKT